MLSLEKIEELLQDSLTIEKKNEIMALEEEPIKGLRVNLIGQKINKLVVIGRAPSDHVSGHYYTRFWCICSCPDHTIVSVRSNNLKSGNTKSCGCQRREKAAVHMKEVGASGAKNLTGLQFGELKALEATEERRNTSVVWKCQCSCGKIHYATAHDLLNHRTESCGHTLDSRGVRRIKHILDDNNIPYTTEKCFSDCIFPDSKAPARFDFFINNQFLLEYDGEQHFKDGSIFFKDSLEKRQAHDAFKDTWCKENNMILKRIPYTALEDISLETIMGDKYQI